MKKTKTIAQLREIVLLMKELKSMGDLFELLLNPILVSKELDYTIINYKRETLERVKYLINTLVEFIGEVRFNQWLNRERGINKISPQTF